MRSPHPRTPFFTPWQAMFAPARRQFAAAARSLRQATLAQIELCFASVFPASLLAQRPARAHSRERIYTLERTLWCWIWQILQRNTSCREVVRQVQALFCLQAAGPVEGGTAAYCQARGKVGPALLEQVLRASARSVERAAPRPAQEWLGGRPVRVVDGTGAQLAETPALRAAYPPNRRAHRGTGFPYLRVVVLFALASGALLAQATGSLQTSELRLWLSLLPQLQAGDILLGDRGFGHYAVAALCRAVGVDVILTVATRCRRVDFRQAKRRFSAGDGLFGWPKSKRASALLEPEQWAQLPAEVSVRLLRVALVRRGFRTAHLVLATTLLDPVAYPAAEIIATHARRWRVEMSLDDLKTTLGMAELHCLTPARVREEVLVYLIAYNLLRWMLAKAAAQEGAELDRLSFKGALDGLREWSQAMARCGHQRGKRQELWRAMLRAIVADPVPERPGRTEPRAVKKRSKYPHLNRPRKTYRGRPSRNQRRRQARRKGIA